jgi:RHS repeat-associated protein
MKRATTAALALIAWLLLPETGNCFYNPSTGRWLNRDPLVEPGSETVRGGASFSTDAGPNLYIFVSNDSLGAFDPYGLAIVNLKYVTYIEPARITFRGRTFNGGVKTRHSVNVDTDTPSVTRVEKYIGPTIEYGANGEIKGRGQASGSTIKAYVAYNNPRSLVVVMEGNEGNPLVPLAPGITYSVAVFFDRCTRKMEWEGSHDRFPSHDFYEKGNLAHHFSHTVAGTTPWNLFPLYPDESFAGSGSF